MTITRVELKPKVHSYLRMPLCYLKVGCAFAFHPEPDKDVYLKLNGNEIVNVISALRYNYVDAGWKNTPIYPVICKLSVKFKKV